MANRGPIALIALSVWVAAATAEDVWENGTWGSDDDNRSINTLSHGIVQTHDLDETGGPMIDQDWMVVPTIARHSYEARISGTNVEVGGACGTCASFRRVNSAGAVLQDNVSVLSGFQTYDRTIRWIATATAASQFVRVSGTAVAAEGPSDVYTIRFWDTTYSVPRWNNSGGQITVFMISNQVSGSVDGQVDFYDTAGTLLHTQPFTLGQNALFVFSTASVPALQGQSGHAYVAHRAGYGGLAGKAVAIEPATGFSFDTPLVARP